MARFFDLSATGAQGSQQERVARSLLSDTETKVVYAQPHTEIAATSDLLGLTDTEAALLPQLDRGIALWNVGERSSWCGTGSAASNWGSSIPTRR